jgi:PKD repeat protein
MKTKTILIGIAVFLYASFPISAAQAVTPPSIIISEIQISGGAGHTNNEFIRLSTTDSDPVALTDFKLIQTKFSEKKLSCSDETLVPTSKFAAKSIPGNGSLLIAHPEYEGTDVVDIFYAKSNMLTENTMRISLLDERGNPIAQKDVGTRCEAEQQTDPIPPSVSDTPPIPPPPSPPIPDSTVPSPPLPTEARPISIRLNEVFPNPSAKGDSGEFIELYNSGTEPTDISGWILRDATKTGKYTFSPNTLLAAAAYLAVTDQSFRLSLNNSNESISLFDSADTLIDSVHYEKTKDDVSLNYTAAGWRGGTPTPGTANILNNLPETREKVPKKGFRGAPVVFSATGKDADSDTLKYTWDFGDGHKSYKAAPSHKYAENGAYIVTLKTTDGKEDILETFTIEIRSYRPPEVRITSLMPNPAGRDTDHEWILIKNRDKKTINLKGFNIATGWKNLVNHPIREDFILKPKQEVRLTRTHSLFTLPNQKGKVELRAPDGTVLQKIRYKLEKSAAENSIYSKAKGKRWEWQEEELEKDQIGKEILPVSDTDENEATPDEEAPLEEAALPIGEDSQKKVLGEKTSQTEDTREKFMQLLSYGTRVRIPDGISLTFDETADDAAPLPSREHYAVSFAKESFSEINSVLNELLSNAR